MWGTLLQDAENDEVSVSVTTECVPLNYAFVELVACWQKSTKSSMALLV